VRAGTADGEAARISAAVAAVVEQVFDTVGQLHEEVLRSLGPADRAPDLEQLVRDLLGRSGQLAVGLGLVMLTGPAARSPVRLLWWQLDPGSGQPRALEPDLDPGSLGYYDCAGTEWFDVPRRTGRRHLVGPYVDVHGTGRYLLTLTGPVRVAGEFAGVVGADVPVDRFETHLLRRLGPLEHSFVLLDADGRVVLSTAPRWLVGDLVPAGGAPPGPARTVPGVPWQLHVIAEQGLPGVLPCRPVGL
jgi:hypothetical protein